MGIWECGNMGIWEYGNVGIWECGNVGIWEYGNVGMWECGNMQRFRVQSNGYLSALLLSYSISTGALER